MRSAVQRGEQGLLLGKYDFPILMFKIVMIRSEEEEKKVLVDRVDTRTFNAQSQEEIFTDAIKLIQGQHISFVSVSFSSFFAKQKVLALPWVSDCCMCVQRIRILDWRQEERGRKFRTLGMNRE